MEHARLFLEVAFILLAAKLVVALCIRLKLAPVFGMVILGVSLGPGVSGLIQENDVITFLGELGVLMLLFMAGLETDVATMKKTGTVSFLGAVGGVTLPFLGGFCLSYFAGHSLGTAFFTGTIFTATSVSITAMTFWDMGKLQTRVAATVLNAAVIDDIIGLVILVFVLSIFSGTVHVGWVMGMVFAFFAGGVLLGLYLLPPFARWIGRLNVSHISLSFAFVVMLTYAGVAALSEVASITGAYMAGVFLGRLENREQLLKDTESIAQSLLIPLFFVNIGLVVRFEGLAENAAFVATFVFIACICKIIGAGAIVRLMGFSGRESLCMGIGMMPRAEVALVIASVGLSAGLIGPLIFNSTIALVIVSAATTPVLLKWSYGRVEKAQTAAARGS